VIPMLVAAVTVVVILTVTLTAGIERQAHAEDIPDGKRVWRHAGTSELMDTVVLVLMEAPRARLDIDTDLAELRGCEGCTVRPLCDFDVIIIVLLVCLVLELWCVPDFLPPDVLWELEA